MDVKICPYSKVTNTAVSGRKGAKESDGVSSKRDADSTEDDVILTPRDMWFYRNDVGFEALYWLLALATGGISLLVCNWYPSMHAKLRYVEVAEQDPRADVVVVVSLDGVWTICPIQMLNESNMSWVAAKALYYKPNAKRMFVWRYERFWWEQSSSSWRRRTFEIKRPYTELHQIAAERVVERASSPNDMGDRIRHSTYGGNETDIDVPPYWSMVLSEALKPFFMFQIFSLAVWATQQYWAYFWSILVMTTVSVLANAFGEWRNLKALQELAKSVASVERIAVDQKTTGFRVERVPASALHPGDVFRVTPNMILPCDAVLITGHAILSEAMLTEESAPVMKASLPHQSSSFDEFKPHSERDRKFLLFSGTKVLQAKCSPYPAAHPSLPPAHVWDALQAPSPQRPIAMAMVVKTGFATARGQLVRAILFPPAPKFDFEKQGYKFIWVLVTFLVIGGAAQVVIYVQHGEAWTSIIKDLLNLVTIAVPPALPLSLSIGLQVSFTRLKGKGIFCSHTRSVAAAGRVNCLCFDKTGTLTQDGLTLTGVQKVESSEKGLMLGPTIADTNVLYSSASPSTLQTVATSGALASCSDMLLSLIMAACHSVSTLDEEAEEEERLTARDIETEVDGNTQGGVQLLPMKAALSDRHMGGAGVSPGRKQYDQIGDESHTSSRSMHSVSTPLAAGQLVGDSLEVQLFLSSGWRFCPRPAHDSGTAAPAKAPYGPLNESNVWTHPHLAKHTHVDTILVPPHTAGGHQGFPMALAILRRLDFDADLRRMGVIVMVLQPVAENEPPANSVPLLLLLLVKGAPESVVGVCRTHTLPHTNLESEMHRSTCTGLRVLACAARVLSGHDDSYATLPRHELERDMDFVGLMSMENSLKKETVGQLALMAAAAFRIMMITGDNPLTAAAVGHMAGAFLRSGGPTLILDGSGKPGEEPLSVSDMSKPDITAPFDKYLCAYISASTVTAVPHTGVSPSSAAPTAVQDKKGEALKLGGPHDLVVTGRAFEALLREHDAKGGADRMTADSQKRHVGEPPWTALEVVIAKANIFARMSPQHKQDLVRALQDIGLVVCMTGDGANDSGALKAGDIGISIAAKESASAAQEQASEGSITSSVRSVLTFMAGLLDTRTRNNDATRGDGGGGGVGGSERAMSMTGTIRDVGKKEEAAVLAAPSIAAPFATGIHHIGAVATVLAEGRCALVTSITMFKYMFLYGLIQFTGVLILYALLLELTDTQYLWADMGVVLGFVILVPTMAPRGMVQRGRPETNLVSTTILRSVIGQTFIVILFQIMQQVMLSREPWYTRSTYDKEAVGYTNIPATSEGTSKFLFSNYQYIFSCLAFCQTYGLFRKPLYRTPTLLLYVTYELTISTVFCLSFSPAIATAFKLQHLPSSYRVKILLLALLNGFVSMAYERWFVPHVSDDEEPVDTPTHPHTYTHTPSRAPTPTHTTHTKDGVSLEELERADRDCPALDKQLTVLPKLRKGPPRYHLLNMLWRHGENR